MASGEMFPENYLEAAVLRRFQARQSSAAAGERVPLYSHALHHAHEQIAQRSIVVAPECNMLAMLESPAREQNRQVGIVVNVRITHAAAVEHHGAVKQPLAILFSACQSRKRLVEQCHLAAVDLL